MGQETAFHRPPTKQSDEADTPQLELAKQQGAAAAKAIRYMAGTVADTGGEQRAGEYVVSYALEDAEGLYWWKDGTLEWVEPKEENLHVEIAVRDGADDRIVPGLRVFVTLLDSTGSELGTHEQLLLWHPCVYHYGRNWRIPGDGEYTLRVRILPPEFPRHDKINGRRFTEPVEVTFSGIEAKAGRKTSN
jgi:hypothetical protein